MPKSALSAVQGSATRAPLSAAVHRAAISAFARHYQVDLAEAEHEIEDYETFADFFARKLKEGVRAIAPGDKVIVSPVDGAVSMAGRIEAGACLQAKGISFPVADLLGDEGQAERFSMGSYATLYLSPRDYHRIHAPLAGQIEGYGYLPGEFWPVNPASWKQRR